MRQRRRVLKSGRPNVAGLQRRPDRRKKGRSVAGQGPASSGLHRAGLLQLQQTHGNAFVRRMLAGKKAVARKGLTTMGNHGQGGVSMAEIQARAREAAGKPGQKVFFAGSPERMEPPGGLSEILSKSGGGTIGVAGGLTIAYDDFKKPKLEVAVEKSEEGDKARYFAAFQPTSAEDARHDSYYPAPGLHKRPGMSYTEGDKTYHYFWRIKSKISELIRRGEQEHLGDHERAFELVYGRVVKEINALAGKKIGPATSEDGARKKALARLKARLPAALGTSPEKWHKKLIELIKASEKRDKKQWHAMSGGPLETEDDKKITPVGKTPTTKIGVVSPKKVVKL